MIEHPKFVMVTCQVGAESAVKNEVARHWPDFRFAYSRPGFVTFKLPDLYELPDDFKLRSIFARAHAFSLGKATGGDLDELAAQAWRVLGERPVARIHAWQRDEAAPGTRGFEPSITPAAVEAKEALRRLCPASQNLSPEDADPSLPARQGEAILDCVIVAPGEWWIGYHRALSAQSRWPGGMMPLELPADAVSRAWLKMEEALRWSRLPIRPGARVAEIGSAPGGASQALLARDLNVTGIDPAEMAPEVLAHPRFTHIRRRAIQVRRREFRKVRWLMVDINAVPKYTLDVAEGIVTHPEVQIRGMLLTLKLTDWGMADHLPADILRIRRWGYELVRARQLQHNGQEVCVAAMRKSQLSKKTHRQST